MAARRGKCVPNRPTTLEPTAETAEQSQGCQDVATLGWERRATLRVALGTIGRIIPNSVRSRPWICRGRAESFRSLPGAEGMVVSRGESVG